MGNPCYPTPLISDIASIIKDFSVESTWHDSEYQQNLRGDLTIWFVKCIIANLLSCNSHEFGVLESTMYYEFTRKVDSLTPSQSSRLVEIRQEFFKYATTTLTRRGDTSAFMGDLLSVYDLPYMDSGRDHAPEFTWFSNPKKCRDFYKSLQQPKVHTHSVRDSIELSPIYGHVITSSVLQSVTNALWNPLIGSLWLNRTSPIVEVLADCAWNSFVDLPWVAQYTFLSEFPEVKLPGQSLTRLEAMKNLLTSCFAVWVAPRNIILCDNPIRVEIQDGQVAGLEFID